MVPCVRSVSLKAACDAPMIRPPPPKAISAASGVIKSLACWRFTSVDTASPTHSMDACVMESPSEEASSISTSFPSASSSAGTPLSSTVAPLTLAAKLAKESIDASRGRCTLSLATTGSQGLSSPAAGFSGAPVRSHNALVNPLCRRETPSPTAWIFISFGRAGAARYHAVIG